jgi:hypothetical protein
MRGLELQAPFRGWKLSGLGRELGTEGLMAFRETKHIRIRVRSRSATQSHGIKRIYRPPHPFAPVSRKASRSTIAPIVALMTRPKIPEPK